MGTYIVRRLLGMVPTLFLVSILTFVIIQLPQGDYATALAAQAAASGGSGDEAFIQTIRHQYGLDQPLYIRYLTWILGCLHGDFGYSFEWHQPVADLIGARIAMTLLLSVLALAFSWVVAIPIGIYSATHQYSKGDVALTSLGFLGLSVPDFMLALVYLFVATTWLSASASGLVSADLEQAPWSPGKFLDFLGHLIPAVIIIGAAGAAQLIRIMRGNLLETLGQQYVTTARAKGLKESAVINRYAVRVAINPLISVAGMQLPNLISGSVIVGVVLSLPTTGPLFLHALQNQDTYLAGTFLLLLAFMLLIGNLLADIALAWADPRIRYD
ncbi:MAG: ABC transporter permease [Chloroflexi bacterium]|nr:ABC transporter permease [Chloroflexota bacterium]MBV9597408.1 ABC transporter permease [Chloroflexota bacterium]